jgi:hypothetical protein
VQQNRLQRKRGFIDSWSKHFDGLQDSSDGMICTYYKKFSNIAGPSIVPPSLCSMQY